MHAFVPGHVDPQTSSSVTPCLACACPACERSPEAPSSLTALHSELHSELDSELHSALHSALHSELHSRRAFLGDRVPAPLISIGVSGGACGWGISTRSAITTVAVSVPELGCAREADRSVFAQRLARSAFGLVLTGTGLLLVLGAVGRMHLPGDSVLLVGWLVALLAASCVWVLAQIHTVIHDIGRLHDRHLAASLAAPMVGLALVLPATLHVLVGGSPRGGLALWAWLTTAAVALLVLIAVRILRRERLVLALGL